MFILQMYSHPPKSFFIQISHQVHAVWLYESAKISLWDGKKNGVILLTELQKYK